MFGVCLCTVSWASAECRHSGGPEPGTSGTMPGIQCCIPLAVGQTKRYLIYLLTYFFTPWSRVLLEKLTGPQLVKFPAFCGTRRFITAFTSVRHLSLSWARSSPCPTPHFLKIHLNIIPPSTPGSPKWSLTFRFPHQNSVYASPASHTRYMPRPSHSKGSMHKTSVLPSVLYGCETWSLTVSEFRKLQEIRK